MAALDRYDAWEATLPSDLKPGLDPDPLDDPLAAVYDAETLSRIDLDSEAIGEGAGRWRSATVGAAVVVGVVTGVRDALETDEIRPSIEGVEPSAPALEAVTVHLAWGDPAASVAIVRPWLL